MSRLAIPPVPFPALDPLLNGNLWQRWAERGRVFPVEDVRGAIRHVRLKPGSSCRLVVLGGPSDDEQVPPPGFILHLYPDARRARTAFEKDSYHRPIKGREGFETFVSETHAVVGVPFPNDPRIPGLRHLYRHHRLREALVGILPDYPADTWKIRRRRIRKQLLSYKPGERAAYRIEADIERRDGEDETRLRLHVKLAGPEALERAQLAAAAIHAANAAQSGFRTPSPRGLVASFPMLASEWIDGRSIESMERGAAGVADCCRLAGRALAGLHRLRPALGASGSLCDQTGSLKALAEDLAGILPGERKRIETLAEELCRRMQGLPRGPEVTTHGDFHMGQVLIASVRPVLVDLDRAGPGPAVGDLGSFLAHLRESGADPGTERAFLEGYGSGGGEPADPRSLAMATASGLLRRTVVPFRRLLEDWPARIGARLDQVEALLGP